MGSAYAHLACTPFGINQIVWMWGTSGQNFDDITSELRCNGKKKWAWPLQVTMMHVYSLSSGCGSD